MNDNFLPFLSILILFLVLVFSLKQEPGPPLLFQIIVVREEYLCFPDLRES